MSIRRLSAAAWVLILLSCQGDGGKSIDNTQQPETIDGMTLVWSDEFDYEGLPDSDRWTYDLGGHGWGNNELQFYTGGDTNTARVADGSLVIEAHKRTFQGSRYTSARLITKGRGDWTYGRIEVRARLPKGRGTWPAIWMLPTTWDLGNGSWPDNGEIDIMEHVGFEPGRVHASIHTHSFNWPANSQKTAALSVPTAQDDFHVYRLDWNEERLEVYVDDIRYFVYPNDGMGWQSWPFDRDFHLLLNIAVGGNWGGAQGVDDSVFPARMEIDYVRVYQRDP